jgi:predicted NUDIX family NTP pyrophosphohydrolase
VSDNGLKNGNGGPHGAHDHDPHDHEAHRRAVSGAGKPLRRSAGIVLFRLHDAGPQVLLGHMGGPFWRHKDAGAWSIPKGGYDDDEDPIEAARREYAEEIGHEPPDGELIPLGEVLQSNGKIVIAWAVEGDLDPADARSNTFELEWPPHSGKRQTYPELDRVAWFSLGEAATKAVAAQAALFARLGQALARPSQTPS